ncbi:MAG: ribonuclease E inhibitor RraB [Bifidobacteriaceae bacterium]|jgi:hypothetical protein|nr:ribonuclease E inhibitor RraB [Bifidobacteriaceae bacterium]
MLDEMDAMVLAGVAKYSDLAEPREWTHYLYVADEAAARSLAIVVADAGWEIETVYEKPDGNDWVVVAEQRGVVLDKARVRKARTFFERAVSHFEGGNYDGWETTV